ncbi:MAG TPA: Yip1 family protein [Chloroflexota bacterium]|nr:Yip1 family protein [Chloroflexota bacterium]
MVESSVTTSSSLLQRMIRAARLEPDLYEEVESDRTAMRDAAIVVVIASIASGIGQALTAATVAPGIEGMPRTHPVVALLAGVIGGLLGWLIWSYVTWFIGTKLFSGSATPGELMRTLGFANTPNIFSILAFVPGIGPLLIFAAGVWSLVAGVVAVRQALDFDTGKAILTTIIGWLALLLIPFLLGLIIAALVIGAVGASGGFGS